MISVKFAMQKVLLLLILIYDAGRGAHIFDPEPEVTWTPPKNLKEFEWYHDGANYTGLLYAGAVEFNWIVDIRNSAGDQDDWAIGNLVSYFHVLTTCKSIDVLERVSDGHGMGITQRDKENQWTYEYFDPKLVNVIRIYYCKHYLWETPKSRDIIEDGPTSGSRSVSRIIRHPRCHYDSLLSDAAIIVMNRGIPALEPRIGYMPTGFDYIRGETKVKIKLDENEKMDYTSPVCYVASYGRDYTNNDEIFVLDYKIKIRVYVTEWNDCSNAWDYICQDNNVVCTNTVVKNYGGETRYCLRPRARVGTVCDHDRGAPLVCNGVVIGMVIRGAKHKYCNNLYKIPFIVEPLEYYQPFFDQALSYNVKPVPTKMGPPKKTDAPGQVAPEILSGASARSIVGLLCLAGLVILSSAIFD